MPDAKSLMVIPELFDKGTLLDVQDLQKAFKRARLPRRIGNSNDVALAQEIKSVIHGIQRIQGSIVPKSLQNLRDEVDLLVLVDAGCGGRTGKVLWEEIDAVRGFSQADLFATSRKTGVKA